MKSARYILLYFQAFGICHFAHHLRSTTKREQIFFNIWTILHLTVLSAIVVLTIYYAQEVFILDDKVELTIDILQWLLPISSQYISIVESYYTGGIRQQFWLRLHYIDKQLLNITAHQVNQTNKKFIAKFSFTLLLAMAVQIYVMICVASDKQWFHHLAFSFFTFVVCCSEVLFCVYFIEMVKYRTDILAMRLNELTQIGKNRYAVNKLRCNKKCYEHLWQAMTDINQAFGKETSADLLAILLFFYLFHN